MVSPLPRSPLFVCFFVHGLGVCIFVWVCGCMAVFFVWAWRRWSVGSGLGCRRGVRCAGVVVLGGGAVGAGLGSAVSRCWGRAGARRLAAFFDRFRRRGFVGLGLDLRFAVVSAWRCLRGAFLAVAGPRVLPHWVNSSLTDGHAYVTYGSTIWELVGTRIQYKFEILVVFLVGMDII